MVLKAKSIDAVRPDVPKAVVSPEKSNPNLRDKRINILVSDEQRIRWKKHVLDSGEDNLTSFIIDAIEEKIAREAK